jgi:hypothetical protein
MREESPKLKIKIVAERADLDSIDPAYLTNNVYAIRYYDEDRDADLVDLVIGKRVDIFDAYYDSGVEVKKIWHANGRRNPKLQECELRVKI